MEPPPLMAARLTITTAAITTAAPTSSSTRWRRRSGASKRCIVSPLRLAYVPRQRRVRPPDPSSHGSDDSPRVDARPPPSAASGGGRQQSQFAGAVDGLGAAVYGELGVDVAHVRLDRAEREVELAADLGGGKVGGEVAEHAQLALAQVLAQLGA